MDNKAPIIITMNKSSSELDYFIQVDKGSIRDQLACITISKDVAYDRIIKFLFQMLGIKDYNRYSDDAGDIFIEVTAPASQILTHQQKMEMQNGDVQ